MPTDYIAVIVTVGLVALTILLAYRRDARYGAAGLGLLLVVTLVPSCSLDARPCSAISASCPCQSTNTPASNSLVILTSGAQAQKVVEQLVGGTHSAYSALGLSGVPAVSLATYDSSGQVSSLGRYLLGGTGDSEDRQKANAELNVACFQNAVDRLPSTTPGDLLRSLNQAVALARSGSPRHATVIALGLGTSHGDGFAPMDQLDFTTSAKRAHAVAVWSALGYFAPMDGVKVVFFQPAAGVSNPIAAAGINNLVDQELCGTIGNGCQRMEAIG